MNPWPTMWKSFPRRCSKSQFPNEWDKNLGKLTSYNSHARPIGHWGQKTWFFYRESSDEFLAMGVRALCVTSTVVTSKIHINHSSLIYRSVWFGSMLYFAWQISFVLVCPQHLTHCAPWNRLNLSSIAPRKSSFKNHNLSLWYSV